MKNTIIAILIILLSSCATIQWKETSSLAVLYVVAKTTQSFVEKYPEYQPAVESLAISLQDGEFDLEGVRELADELLAKEGVPPLERQIFVINVFEFVGRIDLPPKYVAMIGDYMHLGAQVNTK